jgi:hypothetical protein
MHNQETIRELENLVSDFSEYNQNIFDQLVAINITTTDLNTRRQLTYVTEYMIHLSPTLINSRDH